MDGSSALAAPVQLETVAGPTILTKVTVRAGKDEHGSGNSCLHELWSGRTAAVQVERVSASSESVTSRDASGRAVLGCDNALGAREGGRRWCGAAYGLLTGGHLHDPRLDLLCTTQDGRPVAFAWVEPARGARYVAVRQPGFVEVYEVAGGLPVRVATTAKVDVERWAATFEVSEHDATGGLLRRYDLEASVAG